MPFWRQRRTIRWRLISTSLLVVGVPLILFSLALGNLLWRFYLGELEQQLRADAWLVAEWVVPMLAADDERALSEVVERWHRHTGLRLIVIDEKGTVRAATGFSLLSVGQAVSDEVAPGMRAALQGQDNSTTWKSPQHDYMETIYVNVPILSEGTLQGAVRVSYSLGQVLDKVGRIRLTLMAGCWSTPS